MAEKEVLLITGARKGIGRFLAEYYLGRGYAVEGCSRKEPDLQNPNYHHHLADVSDEGQVKKMFSEIQRRHGRLDVVINNAGIASMNHVLLTPADTVDKVLATNLKGTFLVCREGAKLMKKSGRGRIVNLTTVAVPLALAGEAVYAASKSAVEMLTKIMARELAEFGITCNAVGPAPISTDLIRGVGKAKIDQIVQALPLRRMGRFEDVANVIDFFIRPESSFVTGQLIYLGGIS